MDVSEDSCEKALSPVCRARCHTWHSGLEHVSPGSTSVRNSPTSSESPSVSDGVKKPSARRNAWGSASYADLIATAIESSPDRRLTLSQIYDWIISNVHYFSDKSDSNSSAGWKNSIRHNLSLHRRFVRVPHSDGKSAWWTIGGSNPDSTTPSAPRWSRSTCHTRHRADTMDPRSYSLQQQRQRRANRKSATDSSSGYPRNTDKKCLEINVSTNFSPANCDGSVPSPDDIFAPSSIGINCQAPVNFPDAAKLSVGRLYLNSDLFLPSSTLGTDPPIANQVPLDPTSSFGLKRFSVPSPYDSLSLLNDDDSSSAMVTQLSPLGAWNQSDGSDHLFGTESSSCTMTDDRLTELFSDVAMSHDDSVSFLSNNDLQHDDAAFCGSGAATFCSSDEAAFCGDYNLAAAASGNAALMLAALTSVVPSLRRGSDAPPPSPESANSDCDVPSSVLNEPIGGLSLSKNIDLENDSAILGSSFPTGWTSLLPFKTDDVSSLSDMDMDH